MLKKTFQMLLISFLVMSSFAFGQELTWQREYDARVNGQLMVNAYSGGDVRTWPKSAFVDIDNDGDLDLFVGKGGRWASESGKIRFYRNDGDKTNPNWTLVTKFYNSIDVGTNANPTFCDIDADGDFDLFVGNGYAGGSGGNVAFYRNDGTPDNPDWFCPVKFLASIDVGDQSAPTFVDIDGDGDFDLFVGGGYGRITFCRNIGTPQTAVWDLVSSYYNKLDLGWKSTPTFTDIDGDGDFDLFIGNDRGEIYFYQNNGTPAKAAWTLITKQYADINFGWIDYVAPTFADIDGDGDDDLFVSEYHGNINFYRNNGDQQNPEWVWESCDFINSAEESTYVEHSTAATPQIFILYPNYPNPFNPTTVIKYYLPKSCRVKLEVFNTLGQKEATLVDGVQEPDNYQVTWNGADSPTGIYFYCLKTKGFSKTMKMTLMK